MNAVLRQVSRELKYRALPELIGKRVVVTSAASASAEVHDQLRDSLPYGAQFKGPELQEIKTSLAKYGILDLRFTVDRVLWESGDSPGMPLLEDFGFVIRDQQPSGEGALFGDDSQSCLKLLQEDINERQSMLKLFLYEQPKRDMMEHFAMTHSSFKWKIFYEGGGADSLDSLLEDYFPKTFEVVDACLTNADFIWFQKHFYM